MALEAWARSTAHESYLPFWGGSHLFLADRYAGEFDRRSELMQGFITDPMVFGASNRFQSLLGEPGSHGTLSMRYNSSDDLHLIEPVLTLNGYGVSPVPAAYFVDHLIGPDIVSDQIAKAVHRIWFLLFNTLKKGFQSR